MLRASALAADSADIDVVSGATYTSLAYAYSLQSALDQLAGMIDLAELSEPAGSPVTIPTRDPARRRAERVMGTVISLIDP